MKTAANISTVGSHAALSIQSGYATIVLQNLSGANKQFLDRELWVALSECMTKEVRGMCLWVVGGEPPKGAMPSPPLPIWAKGSGRSATFEAYTGRTSLEARMDTDENLPLMDLLRRIPHQVIGLAEGSIGSWGTLVLSACHKVIATRSTMFRPMEDHTSLDGASGNWDQLVRNMSMEAVKALEIGFVAKLVESTEALAQERNLLHRPVVMIKPMLQPEPSQAHAYPTFLNRAGPTTTGITDTSGGNSRMGAIPSGGLALSPSKGMRGQLDLEPWKVEIRDPSPNLGNGKEESHATSSTTSPSEENKQDSSQDSSQDSNQDSEENKDKKDKKDLVSEYLSHDGPITTLMICNLPCRITQKQLQEVIDEAGFKEKYDFLNLPTGGRSAAMRAANLGYGFINFANPDDAALFYAFFSDYRFDGTYSEKACAVRPAHLQGLSNNLRHMPRKQRSRRQQGMQAPEAAPEEESLTALVS
jgi:hypothetical protein